MQPPEPLVALAWQVPSVLPDAITQFCEQQSVDLEQTSLVWLQNDDAVEQVLPAEQSPEQQSLLTPQLLPPVLHPPGFSDAQKLLVQVPLQHAPLDVQACPSETQAAPQRPPMQASPQQSVPTVQLLPVGAQLLGCVQVDLAESHTPEQQVELFVQLWPNTPHDIAQVSVPGSQIPEQQSAPVAQVCATFAHDMLGPSALPSSVPPLSTSSPLIGSPQPPQRMNRNTLAMPRAHSRVRIFVFVIARQI